MSIAFSERPGRHERHYRRRLDNPLFGDRTLQRDDESLFEVQRLDHEELLAFITALRATIQQVVDLGPNVGSEVVLELKEKLDQLYEQSAGLAEDQSGNQSAIAELVEVIMRNVERAAVGDPQAAGELAQEREARDTHFGLLRTPLVADLLHPDSVILAEDLAPTLLSAGEDELAAALALFDVTQLADLYDGARRCLDACETPPAAAAVRLRQIADRLAAARDLSPVN
jgi:hypothetical protein